MLTKSILTLIAVTAAGFTSNLKADQLFDWSFTTTGNVVDGSGTLAVDTSGTVTVDGNTGYAVTSFSGTYLGQNIDGLLPLAKLESCALGDTRSCEGTGRMKKLPVL